QRPATQWSAAGRPAARAPRAGHAAAAPPSSVMNSRRFPASTSRASNRKDSTPQLRQETAALQDLNPRYVASGGHSGGARCGRRSSPIAATLVRGGLLILDRLRQGSKGRRSRASAPPAARAPRAATRLPPPHRQAA